MNSSSPLDEALYQWIIGGGIAILLLFLFLLLFFKLRKRKKTTVFAPLTEGLKKTQSTFQKINELLKGKSSVDVPLFSELEEILISADVGIQTTQKLLHSLSDELKKSGKTDTRLVKQILKTHLLNIFEENGSLPPSPSVPHVVLVVGINGVGKTTTIGKIAKRLRGQGKKVLLAAGDTFRAGAVDQLKIWSERADTLFLAQGEGADPAAVAFDAVKSATAKGIDYVLIDTAGRLHNKSNLMEEMKKVKRVIGKALEGAPHEVLLVIDATNGQNAWNQTKEFNEAIGLTGLVMTKLDGTPKGGMLIGIRDQLKIPIRYIGVGEKVEDLREFNPKEFIDSLLSE